MFTIWWNEWMNTGATNIKAFQPPDKFFPANLLTRPFWWMDFKTHHPHRKPPTAYTPGGAEAESVHAVSSARGSKTHHTFQLTAELLTLNTFDLNNRRNNTLNHSKDILWQRVLFCISGKVQATATWVSVIILVHKPCLGLLSFSVWYLGRVP